MPDISRYVYGTTRLSHDAVPRAQRVAMAGEALRLVEWMHTSHQYGDALQVLREAMDATGLPMRPAIYKIGWDSVDQIRDVIRQNLEPLGLSQMPVGQLCLGGVLAEDFRTGGACYEGLAALKEEGLVGRFVLECWPWTSEVPLGALRAGPALKLVDGLIFYLNPLQRFVSNDLWDLVVAENVPVVAMRTVSGGDVRELAKRDPSHYLTPRAAAVLPIYERSGCVSWSEFCVRFALGFSFVRATVGSTSRPTALQEFLGAAERATPLPEGIVAEIHALQRQWSHDYDRHAAPWSM